MSIYPIGMGVILVGTPPAFSALSVCFVAWFFSLHFSLYLAETQSIAEALRVCMLVPYIVSCAWAVRFWKKGKPPYNCTVFKRGDSEH